MNLHAYQATIELVYGAIDDNAAVQKLTEIAARMKEKHSVIAARPGQGYSNPERVCGVRCWEPECTETFKAKEKTP